MAWSKSTKQRRAARRRGWAEHLRSLPGFEERFLAALRTPPECQRLTTRQLEWAKSVAVRFENGEFIPSPPQT